jgi:8-oxo-dGTP diphosphatase
MNDAKKYLCRDINGDVHIVSKSDLIQRSSVYAVIKEKDGGVLLVHDRTSDTKWDLPGGGIEAGEDVLQALSREVTEETTVRVIGDPAKICEFTEYFYDIDSQKGWESTRYFYSVSHEGSPHLYGNNDDILEARYFKEPLSPNEVAPVAREVISMANAKS